VRGARLSQERIDRLGGGVGKFLVHGELAAGESDLRMPGSAVSASISARDLGGVSAEWPKHHAARGCALRLHDEKAWRYMIFVGIQARAPERNFWRPTFVSSLTRQRAA